MSDSSELSEVPSEAEESLPDVPPPKITTLKLKQGKLSFGKHAARPPPSPSPPREPSPVHDYVLADNADIPFLVTFRHRFADAFPKNVPNLGPQDIEDGVIALPPTERIENLLCALLGLVLNRKKEVERGHHTRALEEAISSNKHQWPASWNGVNPLPGQRTFPDMGPEEKLTLLRALVLWSLNSSDIIKETLAVAYKQSRKEDDMNQPLAVQPWGTDGRKRKYWLIEGQNDTSFRIYKQSRPKETDETWFSVAGSLDELRAVADDLRINDGGHLANRLADRMELAIPRLEASEEKRKRKEYRQSRKATFIRPDPGFSLYEGRTRGKRMKYTFSDEEDEGSEVATGRRSNRSDRSTPVDGPTITSSGRQVRSRFGRSYGDPLPGRDASSEGSLHTTQGSFDSSARRTRGQTNGTSRLGQDVASADHTSDEDDEIPSGEEWHGDDDDFEGRHDHDKDDDDDLVSDDGASDDSLVNEPRSLVVTLKYQKPKQQLSHLPLVGPDGKTQNQQHTFGRGPSFNPGINGHGYSANGDSGVTGMHTHQPPSMKTSMSPGNVAYQSPARPSSSSSLGRQTPAFKPDPYGPYQPGGPTVLHPPEQYFRNGPYPVQSPSTGYHDLGNGGRPQSRGSPSTTMPNPYMQSPHQQPPLPHHSPYAQSSSQPPPRPPFYQSPFPAPQQNYSYGPPPQSALHSPPLQQQYNGPPPTQHPYHTTPPSAGWHGQSYSGQPGWQQQPFPGALQLPQQPTPQPQHGPSVPTSATTATRGSVASMLE